ncbi:MAG TPA: hypothetical protein VIQ26_01570 [Microbacteriaceae bacterium]
MTDAELPLRYVRDLSDPYESRQQHARAVTAGRERRVARGVYLPAETWATLDARERYVALVRAVAGTRGFRPVISHWSAAAVHELPIVGSWPSAVHTIVGPTAGGRSRGGVVKHAMRLEEADVIELGGLLVTSVARTVLDIASVGNFMTAVTMADRAIHVDRFGRQMPLCTKEELFDAWERSLPFRAFARSREVIAFAETNVDSPLESVSRVTMRVIGCPRPLLQTPYYDHAGFIGDADFDWPDYRTIGEADGDIKYLDRQFRNGRTAEQVVLDEKIREDRFRALPRTVTRWRWPIAVRPDLLRANLIAAGLPMGQRW